VTIRDIDHQLFAQTLLQPTRESQCKSGRALLMVASSTWEHSLLNLLRSYIENGDMHGLHPVIFAAVGKVAGLDEENTVFAFLHSFLTSLCGASIRLGKVGHINAQIILKEMGPALNKVAKIATLSRMDDIWSCTPFIDIAQLAHPSLPQKLFSN
jgi:urease accessory protein